MLFRQQFDSLLGGQQNTGPFICLDADAATGAAAVVPVSLDSQQRSSLIALSVSERPRVSVSLAWLAFSSLLRLYSATVCSWTAGLVACIGLLLLLGLSRSFFYCYADEHK